MVTTLKPGGDVVPQGAAIGGLGDALRRGTNALHAARGFLEALGARFAKVPICREQMVENQREIALCLGSKLSPPRHVRAVSGQACP